MKQTMHTPGPWTVEHGDLIVGADEDVVATIHRVANTRLISAAPEMLAALKLAFDALPARIAGDVDDKSSRARRAIYAAIAKAEGR